MKIRLIIIFIFILFFLYSQDDYESLFENSKTGNTDASSDIQNNDLIKQEFSLTFNGDLSFEFHLPVTKDHLDFYGDIKAPRFNNDLGIEFAYRTLSVLSNWQIDARLNDFSGIDKILLVQPLENSIKWSPWKFNIGVGFQYFNWGTADGINPTDNLNPRDYRVGLDAEKLPVLSVYAGFYPIDFFSIEAVYIPFEQMDFFPDDFTESIPEELFYGLSLDISKIPSLDFNLVENPKDAELKSRQFDPLSFTLGGKLNFYLQYIDFSFSYIYDYDRFYTPLIELKKDTVENSPDPFLNIPAFYIYRIRAIDLVKKRIHRFGADMKTSIDRFGLWLEICYTITEDFMMDDYKIRNHNLSWVAGFDFNYGPDDDFYFNLQYIQEINPFFDDRFYNDYEDGEPEAGKADSKKYMEEYYYRLLTNKLGGIDAGLIQAVSINLKWPVLNDLVTPSVAFLYSIPLIYDYNQEIRYGGIYLNPELDIIPFDSFHIIIGADLYYSWNKKSGKTVDINTQDRIGGYYFHNNIYIEVRYKWKYQFKKQ